MRWPALLSVLLLAGCVVHEEHASHGGQVFEDMAPVELVCGDAPHGLVVRSGAGSIEVIGGREGSMRIEARKTGPDQAALDATTVSIGTDDAGVVEITTHVDGVHGASVGFRIEVPASTAVQLRTKAGSIGVSSIAGGFLRTGAGSIAVEDLSGDVGCRTSAGSVTARRVGGDLEVDTGAGAVDIEGVAGAVVVGASTGSIRIAGLTGPCRAESGVGSITVTIAGRPDHEVLARTNVGSISSDFPYLRGDAKNRRGTLGAGRHELHVRTRTGSIALRAE